MKTNLCKVKQGFVFKYHDAHWMKLIKNKHMEKYACVKLDTGEVFLFNGDEKVETTKIAVICNFKQGFKDGYNSVKKK